MAGGLFVEVGMMLVEGRMSPTGTVQAAGPPKPGPHCPQLAPSQHPNNHVCNESNHMCVRAEALRRHMSLLSESRVPMCIDVYLCADCACGRSRAVSSQPAPTDLLLEQWTVAFNKAGGVHQGGGSSSNSNSNSTGGGTMEVDSKGLLAAIRSQLHFSQLSAWYSRGSAVGPVCYRLSHPAPAPPAPPFYRPPTEHTFPLARTSTTFLKVSMKALPRLDVVPKVVCPVHASRLAMLDGLGGGVAQRLSSPQHHHQSTPSTVGTNTRLPSHQQVSSGSSSSSAPSVTQVSSSSSSTTPASTSNSSSAGSSASPPQVSAGGGGRTASPVPGASAAASATLTAFRTVFAELGHCLLDPPSRIPPLKQGFLAWRERRSQAVSSQPVNRSTQTTTSSVSSSRRPTSSIGMVDDRMQCGCKHIGKHHCEEPLDTDQETNQLNTISTTGCDKERRKSVSSPTLSRNDLNLRTANPAISTNPSHHCSGSCRERALNKVNSSGAGGVGGGGAWRQQQNRVMVTPLDGCNHATGTGASTVQPTPPQPTPPQLIPPPIICPLPQQSSQTNPLKRKRQQEGTNSKKLLSERQTASDSLSLLNSQQLVDSFRRLDIDDKHDASNGKCMVLEVVGSKSPPSPLATSPLPSSLSPIKKGGWTDSSSEETESESPSRPSSVVVAGSCTVSPVPGRSRVGGALGRRWGCSTPYGGACSGPLLGNMEESLLKRRILPAQVVSGYTADLGASGAFCPKHLTLPATVEFYPPMGLSTPLLGCMVMGKKGYSVPRCGTMQATLLNPHGTVVKMFVVPYDLTDMPPNSTTFIRQRTTSSSSPSPSPLLRYLIHLRFSSSKSGRIYLEGEILMLVCRQYDADATLGLDPLESNSHLQSTTTTISPQCPKYSSRK